MHMFSIINNEVSNLLDVGFIWEVQYLDWLANIVVVRKKSRKWQVCINFKDLNKSFLKDPFPLLHIDKLVDVTTRHQLISFIDAFSRYNQYTFTQTKMRKILSLNWDESTATKSRLSAWNMMFVEPIGQTMEVYKEDLLVKSLDTRMAKYFVTIFESFFGYFQQIMHKTYSTINRKEDEMMGYIFCRM